MTHRPFLQLRSTLSRSQYTSFHGRVMRLSRAALAARSMCKPSSRFTLFRGDSDKSATSAVRLLLDSPLCKPSKPGTLPPKASSRVTIAMAVCPCSWPCPCSSCPPTPTATEGLPSCSSTFSRRLSNRGKPHPHFSHFRSICCPHIRRHNRSSSANAFHELDTCAARPREIASRLPMMRMLTSRGRMENGSTRMMRLSESDK